MYNVCWGGIIYMEGTERAITHMGKAERGIYFCLGMHVYKGQPDYLLHKLKNNNPDDILTGSGH